MFATAIHADVPFEDLHAYLCKKLEYWSFGLDGHGCITDPEGGPEGTYALVRPERFEGFPWHRAVSPCPFVPPLVGYLHWDAWWDKNDFPLALFDVGRGTTARVEEGRTVDAIALRTIPLDDVFGKWSFDDGDALLTHDEGPYRDYVMSTVGRALEAAGFFAHFGWMVTCHNPLALSSFQAEGSQEMLPALWAWDGSEMRPVDPDTALCRHTVELWTFDFAKARDEEFWDVLR